MKQIINLKRSSNPKVKAKAIAASNEIAKTFKSSEASVSKSICKKMSKTNPDKKSLIDKMEDVGIIKVIEHTQNLGHLGLGAVGGNKFKPLNKGSYKRDKIPTKQKGY